MLNKSSFLNFLFFSAALASGLFLFSCGNSAEKETIADAKQDSVITNNNKDTVPETKLFSLPAPMQIATAIKNSNSKYSERILLPIAKNYTSDFDKLFHLGMYAVDLGYANVYDQRQTSINYFSTSLKLADEQKIIAISEPGIIKRFKDNVENSDSVTYFTLTSFSSIHQQLKSSSRESDAYLLLTGSYIEGVYLSCKVYEANKDKKILQLVGEQKLFLENILELLPPDENNTKMTNLISQLNDLKKLYDKVEISYTESGGKNRKVASSISISDDQFKEIQTKINMIRNGNNS